MASSFKACPNGPSFGQFAFVLVLVNMNFLIKPSCGFNVGELFSSFQNPRSPVRKMMISDADITDNYISHKVEDTFSDFLLGGAPRKITSNIVAKSIEVILENEVKEGKINTLPFLLKGAPIVKSAIVHQNIIGRTIVPTPCSPGEQAINITSILLKPDIIYFPGSITFGFDITFNQPIAENAMLTGDLQLYYQAGSGAAIKIPCIGNIGSCSYPDLCGIMRPIAVCPKEFNENSIPCKCPFNKGRYKLPALSVDVDASVFIAGTYKAEIKLSEANAGQLACYNVAFTIGG